MPIAHIVLFRPKAGLADEDRQSLAGAIERARREIPGIRRFHVGRRTLRTEGYAASMPEFPYLALIEVDDEAALRAYLAHPAHAELARLFWATSDTALAYDFDLTDALGVRTLLD